MSNGKVILILLTVGLIKQILLYEMSYFPESCTHKISKIQRELDLPDYAIKSNLKNARGVDTLKFDKQDDSASLKTETDQLNICKLEATSAGSSKLSDVLESKVYKGIESYLKIAIFPSSNICLM